VAGKAGNLRKEILDKVSEYFQLVHKPETFVPGKSTITYGRRVFDEKELQYLVESSLDFWLTYGDFSARFEKSLADFLGIRHCSFVSSGSSANMLAFMSLTSDKLKDRKIERGDEVITVAAGFPTTVSAIVQYGAVPVFVDVSLPTYNIDCSRLEEALSSHTKAVMLAHTLGNPFDIDAVKAFCEKHGLWLIEDNCDALGSAYGGKYTGTFGDISTSSFYPPHHITTGEGGAVFTDSNELKKLIESFRDWGRDCWCPSGQDNTCKKRFSMQFGELPLGYDHKYVYSHFGYNLKATEMQAAIGCAQIEKLPSFIEARKKNFSVLYERLRPFQNRVVLPEATGKSDPSWFGFPLTVKEGAGFTRKDIVSHLEGKGIQTRMLFGGNLVKQPCFDGMRKVAKGYRVSGGLETTDLVMNNTFWIGVYPGLAGPMLDYMTEQIQAFLAQH
jgi:CDP-6-deoxy-D-xylo-4-hexulose-3-dehydrase